MSERQKLTELYVKYAGYPAWQQQMRLLAKNPVLYLEEYQRIPADIYRWKNDEELAPAFERADIERYFSNSLCEAKKENETSDLSLCVGIGTYRTQQDGEIYMCSILNSKNRCVEAYSFGVYRSPELVKKALQLFFDLHQSRGQADVSLLSSRNPIYRTKQYQEMIGEFPVSMIMTQPGTRGGAAVVSTYFSRLMRRKGTMVFQTWQDAVDWLTEDILQYNLSRE